MAVISKTELRNGDVKDLDMPQSPGADYGLMNDFDPAKYEFYNPTSHEARRTIAGHSEKKDLAAKSKHLEDDSELTDDGAPPTPEPLSPIEELDDNDDENIMRPLRQSKESTSLDPFQNGAVKKAQKAMKSNSGRGGLEKSTVIPCPVEHHMDLLFSRQHLQIILSDPVQAIEFIRFLRLHRPDSIPILEYYLRVVKALKAIRYAESLITELEPVAGHAFTTEINGATMAWVLEDKINQALDVLFWEDMPAFLAFTYVRTVNEGMEEKVTREQGSTPRALSDGLAEVFVLSDPARPDNPIVFSSEEFHSLSGYTRNEFLGHNCRILGGKKTSPYGIKRFKYALEAEREHCEILLNYHRNGSPFINLVMCVPLRDQSNRVRYYLGAQLDITELVSNCIGLSSLRELFQRETNSNSASKAGSACNLSVSGSHIESGDGLSAQEFGALERLEQACCETIASNGENFPSNPSSEPRELSAPPKVAPAIGFYQNYLLVRPHPSLRILFASPTLQTSGILQKSLMKNIGGSSRVRQDLAHALEMGRKVTAKVQWVSPSSSPKICWLHCTPLLGVNDTLGVWVVILVDAYRVEGTSQYQTRAPGVSANAVHVAKWAADPVPWETARKDPSGQTTATRSKSDPEVREDDEIITVKSDAAGRVSVDTTRTARLLRARVDPIAHTNGLIRAGSDDEISIKGRDTQQGRTNKTASKLDGKLNNNGDRPSSTGSIRIPIQTQMQPTLKIAGHSPFEKQVGKPLPINMPGPPQASTDDDPDGLRPIQKRTYKSLSPYGIIFDD